MLESSKYNKKINKHIYVKKAICSKDETIFNFMIHLLNDNFEVINNFLLAILKLEIKRYNNTNSKNIQVKFDFIKLLLRDNCIKGYTFSFPSDNISDLFLLTHNSLLYYLLCN